MKKYLLLAVIGLISASLQTMEPDRRNMDQKRKEDQFRSFLDNMI